MGNATESSKVVQGLRISFVADLAMIIAVVTLVFWVGRQAERLDGVAEATAENGKTIDQIKDQNTKISGQVLQMSSTASVSAVEQRISVAATRLEAQEQFTREMKSDIVTRLNRIEAKLDR